ncbi:PREDICTED: uncharacterized protein LOC109114933 [Nelumbo nucifera]|uniref:Uncharacterized protein LOC109114933 n=1 Tax=Nelumbo nucifera TaxID=4432 RepID=A0A1U8Q5R1_NELNU|nr:PREDICTED: uncharacterized protein LOC109114933 [Nelumbo nucifera]
MATSSQLSQFVGEPLSDLTQYRSIVGALQYVTLTRPDVAFVVNKVYQFLQVPTDEHWGVVKRIQRYLKGTIDSGLFFSTQSSDTLTTYSDADWAGCPDNRHSTGGYGIFLGSHLISWSAKKQPTIARSSMKAEFRALAYATIELLWLNSLLSDLGVKLKSPPVLYCDSIGARYLAAHPIFWACTKHIEVDFHFLRDLIVKKCLIVRFLPTQDQLADIFTKPLLS